MIKKTSIINKPSIEEMTKITNDCNSLADILRYFGLHVGAGNYKTLKKRLNKDKIPYNHIKLGLNSNKGRKSKNKIDINNYLVFHGPHIKSQSLKLKLIEAKLLENKCYICNQLPEWNNKQLVLQIDHINGDHYDNRLKNLRIVCPNCHTQTETFGNKKPREHYNCLNCHKSISKRSKMCKGCHLLSIINIAKNQKTKIVWPNTKELITLTSEFGFSEIGRRLGVSDNAIRKHIKAHP